MMKERGLTFCQALVPAVLDGSKFVTRRLGGLNDINENPDMWLAPGDGPTDSGIWVFRDRKTGNPLYVKCRQGVAGDRFYMQEAWGLLYPTYKPFNGDAELIRAWQAGVEESTDYHHSLAPLIPVYKADHVIGNDGPGKVRWRSGRFQYKWACRLQQWELINIWPERLQEITEDDAVAEGVGCGFTMNAGWPDYQHIENGHCTLTQDTARMSFATLWDTINAKRGYAFERNNWVWREEWNPKPVRN